jgi:acyl-coenzyme A synthetase/AMP-(fatty) acid ligase
MGSSCVQRSCDDLLGLWRYRHLRLLCVPNASFDHSLSTHEHVVVYAIPTHPIYAGEIQGKMLGMAVEIFDDAGKDISESGMAGELVCTRPHPSIPVCFWGDDARGTLFLKAYYDTYPGVWRHGDFIAMNPRTRGYIIFGRRFESPTPPYFLVCAF